MAYVVTPYFDNYSLGLSMLAQLTGDERRVHIFDPNIRVGSDEMSFF